MCLTKKTNKYDRLSNLGYTKKILYSIDYTETNLKLKSRFFQFKCRLVSLSLCYPNIIRSKEVFLVSYTFDTLK